MDFKRFRKSELILYFIVSLSRVLFASIVFGFMFIFFFGFGLCFFPSPAFGGTLPKAIVVTELVKKAKLSDTLLYPAVVNSKINAFVNAESEGIVNKILVVPGSRVKKNETLVILANPDPVYKFAPVSIKAPVAGYVSEVEVSLLSKVEKGQKLLAITDPSSLKIEIEVPSSDLAHLKIGNTCFFKEEALSAMSLPCTLSALSPLVDAHTGTAKGTVEILFNLKEKNNKLLIRKLRPGQIGQVKFTTNERTEILIPESSIFYREGKTWVRVLQQAVNPKSSVPVTISPETGQKLTKAYKLAVTLGNRVGDNFEVLEGLSENSHLIIRSSRFVTDGEEVEVEKSETTASLPVASPPEKSK